MGDIRGFLKVKRKTSSYRSVDERVKDYCEVCVLPEKEHFKEQASRCMDCGTPFCHWACPVGNYIPEWNDFMYGGHWKKAIELLSATNNLPEITGRLCPALCEYGCVLGINDEPVTIRENEMALIEYGFNAGLIKPRPPEKRTGKKIAIIGSGPAGLSCADQLNKAGHVVVVFEKADKIGGILRYGIPDFKLEKWIIERRIDLFKKEGIVFRTGINVGKEMKITDLKKEFDAICLAGGCRVARDLKIEGRDLKGIHFAMDYLTQSNRRVAGARHKASAGVRQSSVADEKIAPDELIDAKGKKVVVIGGGDTGADCVGTAHRQGAKCVTQIELLLKPSECRTSDYPWPKYPIVLKTSTSHEEGGIRQWSVLTKRFSGENGCVKKLSCVNVDSSCKEIPGTEFEIKVELVILALGFLHPQRQGLLEELNIKLDPHGNVKTDDDYMTSAKGIFSSGDMHRGQSLVVWAIAEGRKTAYHIDKYLMGETYLPQM